MISAVVAVAGLSGFNNVCGQYVSASMFKDILNIADSVIISTVHIDEKFYEKPLTFIDGKIVDVADEGKGTYIEKSAKLTKKEVKKINSKFYSLKNFYASPPDYDIEIDYYFKGSIIAEVTISSYKRTVVIEDIKWRWRENANENGYELCCYYGKISKRIERYITKLLIKKKLWQRNYFNDL